MLHLSKTSLTSGVGTLYALHSLTIVNSHIIKLYKTILYNNYTSIYIIVFVIGRKNVLMKENFGKFIGTVGE